MYNSKTIQTLCDFQSGTIDILHLVLRSTDLALIEKLLASRLNSMPNFFDQDAILIDLRAIDHPNELDILGLKKILKSFRVELAGVVIDSKHHYWAKNNNLIVFDSRKALIKRKSFLGQKETFEKDSLNKSNNDYLQLDSVNGQNYVEKGGTEFISKPQDIPLATVIDKPLRSGQSVYAPTNLVVLATVNPGSEIIAGGDIYIYAPLRGRALAGVRGNLKAKIFCTHLDAELISIAGIYGTAENLMKNGFQKKAAQISLQEESLIFEAIMLY